MGSSSAIAWATGKILIAQPFFPSQNSCHRTLISRSSIFVHARDTADRQALIPGSKVSFVYETDEKGGKAKDVAVEEMSEATVLDEGPREMGTVKV